MRRVIANAGASVVTTGEPVVNGPCADVALTPSFVIAVTFFFRASAMLTVNVTEVLVPEANGQAGPRDRPVVDRAAVAR